MPRRKHVQQEQVEITVWPSSLPEDIGSIAPPGSELSVEHEDLGSRFLSDAVEQNYQAQSGWTDEYEEEPFDAKMADDLLRSFGLKPMRRTTTRPVPHRAPKVTGLALPPLPNDLEEFITPSDELDLTEETIHEASLLDHEGEEPGEVESPRLRTEDTRTHGKPRGGHARTSLRPPRAQARR